MSKVNLNIDIEVEERWAKVLVGFFETLEALGKMGCSRTVGIFADGDGSFRPKFKISGPDIDGALPIQLKNNHKVEIFFDAN